jgi:hypothetical protein
MIIMITAAIVLSGCNNTNQTGSSDIDDKIPEKPERITEETVTFELNSVKYDRHSNALTIDIKTGLPDHSKVIMTLQNDEAAGKYEQFVENHFVPDIELEAKNNHLIYTFTDEDFKGTNLYDIGYYINLDIPVSQEENAFLLEDYPTEKDFEKAFPIYKDAVVENDPSYGEPEGYLILGRIDKITDIKDSYSFEKMIDSYRNNTIEYKQLEKNPNFYAGEHTVFTGEILQIVEERNDRDLITTIRLQVSDDPNEVIYVNYTSFFGTDFVRGDQVTVYGDLTGATTYESIAGYEITLPSINALLIE